MAENVLKLKKRAVELGMTKADAMKATREELESFILNGPPEDEKPAKSSAKKKGAKGGKKVSKKKAEKAETEKPAKKTGKKSSAKKSTKKAAKAENDAKPKKAGKASDVGRAMIGSIDWDKTSNDWKPRKGGPTEKMFRALKKAKGNVDKAFSAIQGDLYDYVGKNKRDGTRRSKAEAETMLRYRLNRTKFEFATRTKQHKIATNRVNYGEGEYAKPKPKRKAKAENKKSSAKKSGSAKKGGKKSGKKAKK